MPATDEMPLLNDGNAERYIGQVETGAVLILVTAETVRQIQQIIVAIIELQGNLAPVNPFPFGIPLAGTAE